MTINILSLLPNTCSTLSNIVPPQYMSLTKNGVIVEKINYKKEYL